MTLEVECVPCLSDNYAYIVRSPGSREALIVDVPEAAPILKSLEATGMAVSHVLVTHHHADHVLGLAELLHRHPARVVGAKADVHRLPPLTTQVREGDSIELAGETAHVIDVSGHTIGHVAYHFPLSGLVFTADSLMALGCGRVFEGTMTQMWRSLGKLAALPPETMVYSGHEYTSANAKFALTIDPDNRDLVARARDIDNLRSRGLATVPSKLSTELATNPFLRCSDPAIQANLGMSGAAPEDVFSEIRNRKDNF
ncbi:MAG: hydroxyacylglutathione hydrolase [Roseovarius sp.]|nr:hydroxyacylglutathione hydrolase [Roseovarius sp.]